MSPLIILLAIITAPIVLPLKLIGFVAGVVALNVRTGYRSAEQLHGLLLARILKGRRRD